MSTTDVLLYAKQFVSEGLSEALVKADNDAKQMKFKPQHVEEAFQAVYKACMELDGLNFNSKSSDDLFFIPLLVWMEDKKPYRCYHLYKRRIIDDFGIDYLPVLIDRAIEISNGSASQLAMAPVLKTVEA